MNIQDKITGTPSGLRAWHQERVKFETTNMICELMDASGVSRKELADRLGKSKGYITQLLDGAANMTIHTISDVFLALGREFHPSQSPLDAKSENIAVPGLRMMWDTTPLTMTFVFSGGEEAIQFDATAIPVRGV